MEILGHLVETKRASLYKMIGELPSISRPMYEMVRYLAPLLLEGKEFGYTILVTGDHRTNKDGSHGGRKPEQREVPLFVVQPNGRGKGDTGETISQLQLAPTLLNLLGLPIPGTMKHPPLIKT